MGSRLIRWAKNKAGKGEIDDEPSLMEAKKIIGDVYTTIEHVMQKVGIDLWTEMMKNSENSGIPGHISLLAEQYCSDREKLATIQAQYNDLHSRHENTIADHVTAMANQYESWTAYNKRVTDSHENDWRESAERHEQEKEAQRREFDRQQQQALYDKEIRHREELQRIAHERSLERERWRNDVNNAQITYEGRIKQMAEEHRYALITKDNEHEEEMKRLKDKHESHIRHMNGKLIEAKETAELQMEKFKSEIGHLQDKHSKMQEQLEGDATVAQARLKNEIRSRNKALLAREKATGMTDGELKSLFLDLLHSADAIARLEWTLNRSAWTTQLQSELSDNPRRLRKQILLDTIWGILFENIFCTPYRLLGDVGHKLESQWQQAFGNNHPKTTIKESRETYIWPEPSFESERWRYETLQQGLQAVEKPLSEYSKRQELRQGYEQSLGRTQEELRQALEKVSSLDKNTLQSILKICEKASKLWLTFGTQRCRLCIMIRGLKTTTESVKEIESEDRFLEFVVRPQLQRYGDSLGELFDSEATIAGCEGESIKILY